MRKIIQAKATAALKALDHVENVVGAAAQAAITTVVHQELLLTTVFAVFGVGDLVFDAARRRAEEALQ